MITVVRDQLGSVARRIEVIGVGNAGSGRAIRLMERDQDGYVLQ